jgi:hypothetical protein
MDELSLDHGWRDEDFPGFHPGGAFILDQHPVQQGGAGAEIANYEYWLLDVLFLQMGEEQVIQAVGQSKTVMPEGVEQENEEENEKAFGGEPSRCPFGLEETDVYGFEKQFEVWNHLFSPSNHEESGDLLVKYLSRIKVVNR